MCAGVESECGSECVQGWRVSVGVSVCRGGE